MACGSTGGSPPVNSLDEVAGGCQSPRQATEGGRMMSGKLLRLSLRISRRLDGAVSGCLSIKEVSRHHRVAIFDVHRDRSGCYPALDV